MADKSVNKSDKGRQNVYSDDNDCVNLLYLETTKNTNYRPSNARSDKNTNIMNDTIIDDVHRLELDVVDVVNLPPASAIASPLALRSQRRKNLHIATPTATTSIASAGGSTADNMPLALRTTAAVNSTKAKGYSSLPAFDFVDTREEEMNRSATVFAYSSLDPDTDSAVNEAVPGGALGAAIVDRKINTAAYVNDIINNSLNRISSPATNRVNHTERLPKVNCPEKIILCLDVSHEIGAFSFTSRPGMKFTPLDLLKNSLSLFIKMKHRLNAEHQFSLAVIADTATWVSDFTCDPYKFLEILDNLRDTFAAHSCHLSSLLDLILQHVQLPETSEASILAPPFIVRVILLYGRSHCIPTCNLTQAQKALKMSPFFYLDALYVHEPPSQQNMCREIFTRLCELDTHRDCYMLEVSHSPTSLYDCVAQLLAHPLQRAPQQDCCYDIEKMGGGDG